MSDFDYEAWRAGSSSEGRPATFAGVLRNVIEWLDLTDPIVAEKFPSAVKGRGAQVDLEHLAKALDSRPTIDATMMDLMTREEPEEEED
jgi:hypothetical protein